MEDCNNWRGCLCDCEICPLWKEANRPKLTPQELAAWVLVGDPYGLVPNLWSWLARRIEAAVRQVRNE